MTSPTPRGKLIDKSQIIQEVSAAASPASSPLPGRLGDGSDQVNPVEAQSNLTTGLIPLASISFGVVSSQLFV